MARPASSIDFFEYQASARRRTAIFLFLYLIATGVVIALVYLGVVGAVRIEDSIKARALHESLWYPKIFWTVSLGVLAVVFGGSLHTIYELTRGGGDSVAAMLGGRHVPYDTDESRQRQLLNIVEEMAIASGVPVPNVYIIWNEYSINAFAAGHSMENAVVAVTEGTLTSLTRDELQGVVAHEFSHILNGDMALNIRLMGIVSGLLVVSRIGWQLFRAAGRARRGGAQAAVAGMLLLVAGYIGSVCGRIIQSLVSRKREYLADASAVQFTRNPVGLAGALKKIAGQSAGRRLRSPNAGMANHMFLADGVGGFVEFLFASHPPITERIIRLEPGYQPEPDILAETEAAPKPVPPPPAYIAASGVPVLSGPAAVTPAAMLALVGSMSMESIRYSSEFIGTIPPGLIDAAHDPFKVRLVVYALLLDSDADARGAQMALLESAPEVRLAGGMDDMSGIAGMVLDMGIEQRLMLLDLCAPALKSLSPGQCRELMSSAGGLINHDSTVTLYEYMVQCVLGERLGSIMNPAGLAKGRRLRLSQVETQAHVLISCISHYGRCDGADSALRVENAYASAMKSLGLRQRRILRPEVCTIGLMERALRPVVRADFGARKKILRALYICASHDGRLLADETYVLRAVSAVLGCPLPPVFPGEFRA